MKDLTHGHGSVEEMKDKLVRDLKSVGADADGLLKEVANSTAEEFAAVRTKIEGKLGEAKSRLDSSRLAVTEKARRSADATHEYVVENPWKVLGIAAAAGIIIGILMSRR
ncbi:MAG: hypothetical protein AzoDbin1_00686 [Azoarcus sp.]|uniref:Membrane-anchored ribosome-binding protein, inhibits growth in stationary phase, ElaB/YqjD/DUF883 family n=1 Tax=Aromatoleum tolulyticum TaxID=34027 RepID=A0A1N6XYL0_9RHOO|nr:DUF883 family protein [Aromatoleum tolulyticum]MCK9984214.1 hypothetical protein [Azoarcus sp.]SIR07394.1 Membrane-anchored ribosome-binding protein, inhibits growth in stationary phase, ElaB/YqjD/DUF883 family [Aromatoleum tolulyticum]